MILIQPKVEIVEQLPEFKGVAKMVEEVGRTCWASNNLITENSWEKFIDGLMKRKHNAPLEHGTIYLTINLGENDYSSIDQFYSKNPYSTVNYNNEVLYITTNLRVIIENSRQWDLKYLSNPTEYHELRITVHFTLQRAISAEYNRHRVNSPMEQSSRYCNFSKDKFGNEISIVPSKWVEDKWIEINSQEPHDPITDNLEYSQQELTWYCSKIWNGDCSFEFTIIDWWWFANLASERSYMELIKLGAKPEEARDILPLDLKSELYHTATVTQWKHFFELRAYDTPGNIPHPEAKRLAAPLYEMFKQRNLL